MLANPLVQKYLLKSLKITAKNTKKRLDKSLDYTDYTHVS